MRQNTKSSINLLACSSFSRMPLQKQIRPWIFSIGFKLSCLSKRNVYSFQLKHIGLFTYQVTHFDQLQNSALLLHNSCVIFTFLRYLICTVFYRTLFFSVLHCVRSKTSISGGVAEWLTRRTINLRIADRVGSNLVRGKPWARNFTFFA
jgi:hypothetical protein